MKYKLKDIFDLQMGKTPSRNNIEYWNTKDFKWISISDLTKAHGYISETKEYISERAVSESGIKIIPANTVVMSFKLSIGKTAITSEDMYSNEAIMAFHDKHVVEILPEYIFYIFKYKKWDEDSNNAVMGKTLNKAILSEAEIEICSIEEQRVIVDILDNMMSVLESRGTELDLLDNLIKARFVEMFGDAVANPKKWPVKKLKDLSVQINSGNTPKGGSENYVKEGIAFFRSQNVWKNRLEMEDIAYIDAKTHANMKRSSLKHGDILMTKTGRINTENSSLGRAALYLGEDDMANVNGHVYFIRLKPGVSNMFVLRILVSPEYVDLIRGVCVGGIDKRQLNKEHIEDFPIICPPTDMVNEYVKFVCQVDKSKLLSLIKLLEQLITYLYNIFIIYRQDKGEEVEDHE
mgnify:CR=1 FL=1